MYTEENEQLREKAQDQPSPQDNFIDYETEEMRDLPERLEEWMRWIDL